MFERLIAFCIERRWLVMLAVAAMATGRLMPAGCQNGGVPAF